MTASLNDMFEAANDAILTHDVNYRVTRANAITESLYGYSSPACERKTYMISVHWTYRRPLMSRCGIRPRTMGRDGKPSMCGRMERFFLWTSLPNRSLEVSSFTLYASSATSENANIREEALRAIDVRFPHYNPAAVEFVEHVPPWPLQSTRVAYCVEQRPVLNGERIWFILYPTVLCNADGHIFGDVKRS